MVIDQVVGSHHEPVDPLNARVRHLAIGLIAGEATQFGSQEGVQTGRDRIDVGICSGRRVDRDVGNTIFPIYNCQREHEPCHSQTPPRLVDPLHEAKSVLFGYLVPTR